MNIWLKYVITTFLVVIISEIAKRSDKFGALVASLPLVTLLTLMWLFIEKQPMSKISNHAYYNFWYVFVTLPFFLIFPYLLPKIGFIYAMVVSIVSTLIIFYLSSLLLTRFSIHLL